MTCQIAGNVRSGVLQHGLRAIALCSLLSAIGAVVVLPAQAQDLNQQLTIHLNSGSRSPARDEADRLLNLGRVQAAEGAWTAAIASWKTARQLYQSAGDMDGQLVAYRYLAAAYSRTNQPIATEDALRRRLAIARDQRDFSQQIYGNNSLGQIVAPRAGGSPAAGQLFVEGMDVASSVRNHRGEYLTAKNMTWLANSLEQPELNTRRYEYAFIPPSEWYANPISHATKLNSRGEIRLDEQRYYMATRFNGVANDLAAESRDAVNQFRAIDNQVVAYRAMGRYDLATDSLDERLLLARSIGSPQQEMITLAYLGNLNQDIGRTTLAQRYYEQALIVAQQLNDSQQTSLLKERLASFTDGGK